MSSSVRSSAARRSLPATVAELRSARQMMTSVPTRSGAAFRSDSLRQISSQCVLPAGHSDAVLLQTLWRQHGIFRTFCRAHELVARGLLHDRVESCTGDNLASKVVP